MDLARDGHTKSVESLFVRQLFVKIDGTKDPNKMCLQRS